MPHNHIQRATLASVIGVTLSLGPTLGTGQTGTQSVQYQSPLHKRLRALGLKRK